MEEKILTNKKHGMLALVLTTALMIAAIAVTVWGAILLETLGENNIKAIAVFVTGLIILCIGWIPYIGLRVLKPNEALVITLFGKYIGTIKDAGF